MCDLSSVVKSTITLTIIFLHKDYGLFFIKLLMRVCHYDDGMTMTVWQYVNDTMWLCQW